MGCVFVYCPKPDRGVGQRYLGQHSLTRTRELLFLLATVPPSLIARIL